MSSMKMSKDKKELKATGTGFLARLFGLAFASLLMAPSAIILSLIHAPSACVYVAMFADFYTPWILFESPYYEAYHQYLIGNLDPVEEKPLIEITPEEATMENLLKISKDFTWPVVIKGLLGNTSDTRKWADPNWWEERYGHEEVLCGTLAKVIEDCTVKTFFDKIREKEPFYIAGASVIFKNNPELHEMIDNEKIKSIEPGKRQATQIFMGVPDMGSDIHCAIAVNVFRQIVGQKKWWFIPPSQTPYLKPSINVNGFSAHTKTLVGKEGGVPSPWLEKIERYTTVLDPGDVLINPPFFWHGIINLGDKESNDLVIGAPSRYIKGYSTIAGFKSSPLMALNSIATVASRYGLVKTLNGDLNLQQDIANNRRAREKKDLKKVDDSLESEADNKPVKEKDRIEDIF